jgi:hypothetical protein
VNFYPPPPSLSISGPLPALVERLSSAIDAESRFAWETQDFGLRLTEDGRIDAGNEYEPSNLEVEGFRQLVVRYNESFPRAFTLLASLTPSTAAAVWRERYQPCGKVLVVERHSRADAPSAVCAVYPAGWPVDCTVAKIAEMVAGSLGGAPHPAHLEYDAAHQSLVLRVDLKLYRLEVRASELYGERAPQVLVYLPTGQCLGTPNTGPARRRRPSGGGTTTLIGVADAVHAAEKMVMRHLRAASAAVAQAAMSIPPDDAPTRKTATKTPAKTDTKTTATKTTATKTTKRGAR